MSQTFLANAFSLKACTTGQMKFDGIISARCDDLITRQRLSKANRELFPVSKGNYSLLGKMDDTKTRTKYIH